MSIKPVFLFDSSVMLDAVTPDFTEMAGQGKIVSVNLAERCDPEQYPSRPVVKGMWVNQIFAIGIGAVLGANARYFVTLWATARLGLGFPYGTLIVNTSGSFILGFLVTIFLGRLRASPEVRLLWGVGFLGSFTTFSSFAVESISLAQSGAFGKAMVNIFANNLLSLGCAVLGVYLARLINQ